MIDFRLVCTGWIRCCVVIMLVGAAVSAWAGTYIFAGEANGIDLVLHPQGYVGVGGQIPINVCIVAGTPNEAIMEQSVKNIIAIYNQLLPTTGNLRTLAAPNTLDFESVALHELGHCIGKAHVNAASESDLPHPNINSTKATDGADNVLNTNAGTDGLMGSKDDLRGDDVNLHWFRIANNNPFTIDYQIVDSTTYDRNVTSLPSGHLFATNGDKDIGQSLLDTPNTEAVMQQGTRFSEVQRVLTPDGVATMKYAMSGIDEIEGSPDDYTYQLNLSTAPNCDINISFDIPTEDGLAYCSTGGVFIGTGHARITTASMHFNPTDYIWHFNTVSPCTETLSILQNQWKMFTLPCSVGISTGATVADVLGDDMAGVYDTNWVVYERDAANDIYIKLSSNSEMFTGKGYWLKTDQSNQSFSVEGQFNGSPDTLLRGDVVGRGNLVGHPFEFPVAWADVQIVDGAQVQSLAAAVADGDLSETYHIWNGNAYDAFDASTLNMTGTLTSFDSIWVKAYKDGIYLRIPSIEATLSTGQVASINLASGLLQATSSEIPGKVDKNSKKKGDMAWSVRVIVESGTLKDSGNVLGQMPDSLDTKDKHDLEELAPFGDTYLTVIFPHEEWQEDADSDVWGYTSDFHATTRKPQGKWTLAVLSSINVSEISLRIEGPKDILREARLRDEETGKLVKFRKGAYAFDATPGIRYFTFTVGRK